MCSPIAKVIGAADPLTTALYITGKTTQKLFKAALPKTPEQSPIPDAAKPPAPKPVTPPPIPVSANAAGRPGRAPNVDALRAANSGMSGGINASSSSTLLTGPGGIDLTQLSLGRNTLLGS